MASRYPPNAPYNAPQAPQQEGTCNCTMHRWLGLDGEQTQLTNGRQATH